MSIKSIRDWILSSLHVVWVVVVLGSIAGAIATAIALYLLPAEIQQWLGTSGGTLLQSTVIYAIALAVTLLPVVLLRKIDLRGVWRLLALHTPPKRAMLRDIFTSWALYFILSTVLILVLAYLIFPELDFLKKQNLGFDGPSTLFDYVTLFLALVVVAPFFEELLFRGYLFGRLREKHSFWPSALVSATVFGLVHMQLNVAIDVAIMGIFACLLREKYNSTWPAIFLHSLKNGIAYVLLFVLPLFGIGLGG